MKKTVYLFSFVVLFISGCRSSTEPLSGAWLSIAQLPSDGYYTKVTFTDRLNGWVVGKSGAVFRTTDGGYNWRNIWSGTTRDLHCVVFVDEQSGWIAGQANSIIRTSDAGSSWQLQSFASDTLHRLLAMSFADSQHGWAVSNYGEIFHTIDGGNFWSVQQSGTQSALTAVQFDDGSNGWASTTNRTVLRTTDSGVNWESVNIVGVSAPILCTDIAFVDKQRGWITTTVAAASSVQTGSPLLYTDDGGTNWSQQAVLPSLFLSSVAVIYPGFAWVAGGNKIFFTQDGGTTWKAQFEGSGESYVSISFVDNTDGWALSSAGTILRYGQ